MNDIHVNASFESLNDLTLRQYLCVGDSVAELGQMSDDITFSSKILAGECLQQISTRLQIRNKTHNNITSINSSRHCLKF